MRFAQNFISLLVTGLLATSAIAGVINPIARSDASNDVMRRDDLETQKLSKADLKKWAKKTCSPIKKRTNIAVGLDSAKGAGPTDTLTTDALSTCMGLVVTGTPKAGKTPNNHFMAHVIVGEENAFKQLKSLVNSNKAQLDNLKSYYTHAGLTLTNTKKIMEEDGDKVSDADARDFMNYMNEVYTDTINQLKALAPVAGKTTHDPTTSNSMSSDGAGKVQVNGRTI